MTAAHTVVGLIALLSPVVAAPQGAAMVAGRVVDARTGSALVGVVVRVRAGRETFGMQVTTDQDGRFRLTLARAATLVAEREGYATMERAVVPPDSMVQFALFPLGSDSSRVETARTLEGLTITALRAGGAPIAETTLDRARLERDYNGQDVPLTLRSAPSVTAFSESGSLLNYSYFRLRGIDQSRINITLDGVPLNEPEDQQIYFSDFPDLTSSVQSMQVQRGVGTSTYGQAAFGGSVNFASRSLAGSAPHARVRLGGGSFGTAMANLEAQSGQMDNRIALSGRISGMRSSGYRDGASSAANSAFLSAGYYGDRDLVKLTATTGLERNGQAYQPVPEAELRQNPRTNPLAGVGDHYRESLAMLSYTRLLSSTSSAGLTAYGFDTRGWYDYPSGAPGPALRFRSASRWAGLIAAMHSTFGRLTIDGGAHGMTYSKDHEFDDRPDLQYPGYSNTGYKTEASAFAKVLASSGMATFFGDLQLRTAEFRYRPTDGYGLTEVSQRWNFANPRAGVTLRPSTRLAFFASWGTTGREPTRGDLFAGADDVTPDDAAVLLPLTRVRPEHVNDLEAGTTITLDRFAVTLNVYDMRFRDEIARTGATTPLGYDIRANVGRSARRGVELEGSWLVTRSVDLGASVSVSRNRIDEYRDEGTGVSYRDVEPILTPSLLASHRITWRPGPRVSLTADGRYQGRTFLAPTGDNQLTTPPFYVLDGGVTINLGAGTLLVQARNVFDRRAYPSGDVSGGVARYFIVAPRSLDVTLSLDVLPGGR
ncbi:MAG TPA: TonB-dependent receptor [Gemmatimonadaceae bacterium]